MWNLIRTINAADPENQLVEPRLQKAFERCWAEFQSVFEQIRAKEKTRVELPKRSIEDMIVEILETTRGLHRDLARTQTLERIPITGRPGVPVYGYASPGETPEIFGTSEDLKEKSGGDFTIKIKTIKEAKGGKVSES